ncbi:30S ribosomal protein S6 [subsurface metagenome]
MRKYEAIFIFQPEDSLFTKGKEIVTSEFEKAGIKVSKEEDMGNRELAYGIKDQQRGHYMFYALDAEPESLNPLRKSLKLKTEVLKNMIFRGDE